MKSSRFFLALPALLCMALVSGCDTPESRIQDSPQIFARLTPDQQALVKAGQVGVGFDMDAVKLALGAPNRVTINTDKDGQREVWHYVTYEDSRGIVIYTGYYHYWNGWGGPRFWGDVGYYNGYPVRVHDRIRVIFDPTNHVASIQQEKP